jgi:23S rRNA (cytosine1962-C5)-methyltransferase
VVPCVLHEDDDLLVVNKPAGMNTHAPSPYAGEGIYDWLRHREPRWAKLAIIHRLDKETSGVMVFSKSARANRSLTEQFAKREVRKKYLLVTDRKLPGVPLTVKTSLLRAGEKYLVKPLTQKGELAETRFNSVGDDVRRLQSEGRGRKSEGGRQSESRFGVHPSGCLHAPRSRPDTLKGGHRTVLAEPVTGRTHQIRVHAAANGFPILGDTLYGGTPAVRVYLHAAEIALKHPATGKEVSFSTAPNFEADARGNLRSALIDSPGTNAYRIIHGASDGWPDWYVDRLGDFLLSQGVREPDGRQRRELERLVALCSGRGVYHKYLTRQTGSVNPAEASPGHILGEEAPDLLIVRENGLEFELSFREGYSVGLFPDQRDNRRRLLAGHVAADFPLFHLPAAPSVLNCFAYTCGFSVCAAKAGALTTSLDLSKKYLEWGRRNFARNGIELAGHDFIFGDVFDWLRRLNKKGQSFDLVLLDPPTFSQSKERGTFRAEKDFGELVAAALPLVKPNGVLFASTNAGSWAPEDFVRRIIGAVTNGRRKVAQQHFVPQPPDFPISREEPGYLKTVWLRIV